MALSANESALLTKTCTNMNIAANTCREVLEMLRSLGNTGVVDIATHNNAEAPHADATNLVHFDSSGNMVLGTYGSCAPSLWSTYYPFMIRKSSNHGYNILHLFESHGATNSRNDYSMRFALTDSNGNMTSLSGLGVQAIEMGRIVSYAHYELAGESLFSSLGFHFNCGKSGETNSRRTSMSIGFTAESSDYAYVYKYSLQEDSFSPYGAATVTLGKSSSPFDTAYLRTAATITSDAREKDNIVSLGSEAVEFVKALRPVQFTVKNGRMRATEVEDGEPVSVETAPGTRRHWGLVAQEVQEALSTAGYEDAAVWCLADKDDPDSKQSLRYEELIAPMIKVIQNQQERIEALERKVA